MSLRVENPSNKRKRHKAAQGSDIVTDGKVRSNKHAKATAQPVGAAESVSGNAEGDDEARASAAPATVSRGPSFANLKKKPTDLDSLLAGDTSNVTGVHFWENFSVVDEDLIRLVDAVGPQLTSLRLGSSDTGAGVYLTDASIMRIVSKCPNLTVLQLESCTGVSDAAFTAVCRRLVKLQELHCTGHDRSHGRLTAKALVPLLKENALPGLQRLYLTDQGVGYGAVQRLIKKRRGVRVLAGETDSDSVAWGCVLQQMGQGYGDGMYGNF